MTVEVVWRYWALLQLGCYHSTSLVPMFCTQQTADSQISSSSISTEWLCLSKVAEMRKEKNVKCLHLCSPYWSDTDAGRQSIGTTSENFPFIAPECGGGGIEVKWSRTYWNLLMPGLGIDTSSPNHHLSSCKLLGALAGLALSLFSSAQLVLLSAVTACVRTCAMTLSAH